VTTTTTPELSVIICTRNPRPDLLRRVLDSLRAQTFPASRYELILVDNGSSPALDPATLDPGRALPLRVIVEPTAGLTVARCTGIAHARAGLLAFVDDDNFLDPDYLHHAVRIAAANPNIGHFGGIARAELEVPVSPTKAQLLGHLGIRDHGPDPITSTKAEWGPWEPIGAGMVARRDVALKWVEMSTTIPEARLLGRAGHALLSGEDTLFARAANSLGYACSYQPDLKLTHYMKRNRLRWRYLSRILEGHGRSYVLLRRALGEDPKPITRAELLTRLRFRLRKDGRIGLITWFWDVGYRAQANCPREPRDAAPAATAAPASKESSIAAA
jgi:GT2 family glycosyltransferase